MSWDPPVTIKIEHYAWLAMIEKKKNKKTLSLVAVHFPELSNSISNICLSKHRFVKLKEDHSTW